SAPSSAAPAARVLMVAAEAQPQPGAWMIPYTTSPVPAADRTSPRQSSRGVRGSREVGTRLAARTATAAVTGTKNTKMLPHQKRSSSQPPAIGPSTIPTPALAPHTPSAAARCRRPVNTLVSSDSVAGNIIAAPRPITARAAVSCPIVVASEPARLAVPNTPRPASSIPFRPRPAPRLPAASTTAAQVRAYASAHHCRPVVVAPTWRTRAGSATLTMVVSRLMISAARHSVTRMSPLPFMTGLLSPCIELSRRERYPERVQYVNSHCEEPVRQTSFAEMACSMARSLELIGDWWTPLIIRDPQLGIDRFDPLARN